MKVNVKPVTRGTAHKSTGSTTAQSGTKSDGRFRRPSESGSRRRKFQGKSGSGKEISSRILSVKANGMGAISADRTPTSTTHVCTYSSSQNALHKNSHSPREHAWLKGQHGSGLRIGVSERTYHPSVMSHLLCHLSRSTSTRSLSSTSPVFRPSSPSLSCPLELDPIMIQLKALQTRILKMENYEKNWPHRCMYMGEEKIVVLLTNPQLQGNEKQNNTEERCTCTTYSS